MTKTMKTCALNPEFLNREGFIRYKNSPVAYVKNNLSVLLLLPPEELKKHPYYSAAFNGFIELDSSVSLLNQHFTLALIAEWGAKYFGAPSNKERADYVKAAVGRLTGAHTGGSCALRKGKAGSATTRSFTAPNLKRGSEPLPQRRRTPSRTAARRCARLPRKWRACVEDDRRPVRHPRQCRAAAKARARARGVRLYHSPRRRHFGYARGLFRLSRKDVPARGQQRFLRRRERARLRRRTAPHLRLPRAPLRGEGRHGAPCRRRARAAVRYSAVRAHARRRSARGGRRAAHQPRLYDALRRAAELLLPRHPRQKGSRHPRERVGEMDTYSERCAFACRFCFMPCMHHGTKGFFNIYCNFIFYMI